MPRIINAIPNLINGVSQQPDAMRLSSQAAEQINALSSIVGGLSKRPPTEHVARLSSETALGSAFLHTINRDSIERYKVIVSQYDVRVWDILGVEKTVNFDDKAVVLQDAAVAVGNGLNTLVYIPAGVTTVLLATSGITTATVIWEADTDPLFSSPTTLRTDTSPSSGTVAWVPLADNGRYVRARISAYTSGTITATITSKSVTYLFRDSAVLDTHVRALTVADYTLMLNTNVKPAMQSDLTIVRDFELMAFAKQGFAGNDHTLTIGALTSTHSIASAGDADTKPIIATWDTDLTPTLEAAGSTVVSRNPIYYVSHPTIDNDASVEDGAGGAGLTLIKGQLQRFSELPKFAKDGFEVEITGDAVSSFSNYYTKFSTTDGSADINEGLWSETVKQGIQHIIDPATMPHQIVREADGTFTYGEVTYGNRLVGDEDSNPNPSFIGEPIHDIFLFRNRLGFLAAQNVIMSRAGEFFEYFRETVTDVLPSAPIDVSASTASGAKGVAVLFNAAAFDRTLLLFSDQQQLVLSAVDVLTPASVQIDALTEYTSDEFAQPTGSGDSIFSPTIRGSYSSIMEYRFDPDADIPNAAHITAHIPTYMKGTVKQMTAAANENMLCLMTSDSNTTLFVHTYFWSGNEKLQSSWSKWNFNGANILDIAFLGSHLYMVIQRDDGVYLERVKVSADQTDDDTGIYLTHLDRKIKESDLVSRTYSSWNDRTVCVLPFGVDITKAHSVVTRLGALTLGANLPGLTLYDASANLFLHNKDFNNVAWTKTGATIGTSVTAPGGGTDAQKLIESAAGGEHKTDQAVTVLNATPQTTTIWVQANTRSFLYVNVTGASAPANCDLYYNAGSKTFGTIGAGVDSTAVTLSGDGWHRIELHWTSAAAGNATISFGAATSDGISSYVGDGTSGIHIYGAQTEQVLIASPLITTTTAIVSVFGQFEINEDKTTEFFYFGEQYTFEYTFSTAVIREDAPGGRGRHMVADGPIVLLGYLINYSDTGHFQVEVIHGHAGTTSTHVYNGPGVGKVVAGQVGLESGVFFAAVKTVNRDATVTLKSSSFIPCKFQSAEWTGVHNARRGRRV